MTGGLLLAWGALTFSMAAHPPKLDPYDVEDIRRDMMYPGLDVKIEWAPCGMINALYLPKTKTVRLCNELRDEQVDPLVARFFFAHEMGHAIVQQLGIPYTVSEEATVDELASYVLVLTGRNAEIEAAANYFATRHMQGGAVNPLDDHPDHLKRAVTLLCYSFGREGTKYACPRNFDRVIWTWNTLLRVSED